MKFMEVQSHHKNPENIVELFMMLGALIIGGIGKAIGEIHGLFIFPPMWLHYLLMGSQGIMYIVSAGVGAIAIYKFFTKKK